MYTLIQLNSAPQTSLLVDFDPLISEIYEPTEQQSSKYIIQDYFRFFLMDNGLFYVIAPLLGALLLRKWI